ncbi:AAA family ATPase [Mannheimia indoligenes]|uniref:AAA family ATPase n=1 Tax=Mannheimia indoligenes TaxID=3103145 RepID=UPI002FE644F9
MSNYQLNPSTFSLYSEKIVLEIMCEHNGFNKFLNLRGWADDRLAYSLGLKSEWDNEESNEIVKSLLKARYQAIKNVELYPSPELDIAYRNIQKLAEYIDLNATEKAIFTLVTHIKAEEMLENGLEYLGQFNSSSSMKFIAKLLDLDEQEVKCALSKSQKLKRYGLIEQSRHNTDLEGFLEWGNTLDFNEFISEPLDQEALLKQCLKIAESPKLSLFHFEYIQENVAMMKAYLSQALNTHQKGVNLLIYGKPGTGKTELATLLANELNTAAYTLSFEDEAGEAVSAKNRLNSCVLAQTLLADRNALIIFDEIEDVFAGSFSARSEAQSKKAWVNHFLENNNVPMIWISNSVDCIDNAYLRRFDMVFEMPMLPNKHKESLISALVGEKLSPDYIRHFAQNADLSPAVLTRTFSVMNCLPIENQADFAGKALGMFNQTLVSQGFRKIEPLVESKIAYNLDWVNCAENMHKISEGLKRTKRGRICCYGPPGTGKTAWANWLAQEIGRPALVRQGSDLLDKYVGGTEQNIAEAFQQAKENDMVLIFDEVDTFLFARESGQRSWEHSQVNEMLTQIEKFEGLLIVSTNLMDNLDPAALRRFDLKLHFGYLNVEQRKNAAISQAKNLGLPELSEQELSRFDYLENLTLGDFAAVARRHRFAPFEHCADWINALEAELWLKPKVETNLEKWVL